MKDIIWIQNTADCKHPYPPLCLNFVLDNNCTLATFRLYNAVVVCLKMPALYKSHDNSRTDGVVGWQSLCPQTGTDSRVNLHETCCREGAISNDADRLSSCTPRSASRLSKTTPELQHLRENLCPHTKCLSASRIRLSLTLSLSRTRYKDDIRWKLSNSASHLWHLIAVHWCHKYISEVFFLSQCKQPSSPIQ